MLVHTSTYLLLTNTSLEVSAYDLTLNNIFRIPSTFFGFLQIPWTCGLVIILPRPVLNGFGCRSRFKAGARDS